MIRTSTDSLLEVSMVSYSFAPAPLAETASRPDVAHGPGKAGKVTLRGLLARLRPVAGRMQAHLQAMRGVSGSLSRLAVEIDQRPEAARLAADDGDHQGKSEGTGTGERLGRPPDAHPDRQRVLHRPRVDPLSGQGGPESAGPVDRPDIADL